MTSNPFKRILPVALLALTTMAIGVAGFRVFSQLSWLDALYMTVTTLSTVGYREVGEPDTDSKLFTIALLLCGGGILVYAVTKVAEIMLDPETRAWFWARRSERRTRGLQDHFIVCGLGRVGLAVAQELSSRNAPFLVLERNPDIVEFANGQGWTTVLGDATEDRILERAGVERARGLVTCVDTDAENLFIIISAKALNPKLAVSTRVIDESNLEKFKRAGATHAYSPYSLLGRRIARTMTRPRVLELLDLALEQANYDLTIDEWEVPPDSPVVGMTLVESQFRHKYGAHVLAVIKHDRTVVHNPPPDTRISAGDILIMLGTPGQLEAARTQAEVVSPQSPGAG